MRPGISVAPGSGTRSASAGTLVCFAGPTASMRSPRTTTTQPDRGASASPSQTASGASTIGRGGSPAANACAGPAAIASARSTLATALARPRRPVLRQCVVGTAAQTSTRRASLHRGGVSRLTMAVESRPRPTRPGSVGGLFRRRFGKRGGNPLSRELAHERDRIYVVDPAPVASWRWRPRRARRLSGLAAHLDLDPRLARAGPMPDLGAGKPERDRQPSIPGRARLDRAPAAALRPRHVVPAIVRVGHRLARAVLVELGLDRVDGRRVHGHGDVNDERHRQRAESLSLEKVIATQRFGRRGGRRGGGGTRRAGGVAD